MTPSVLTVAVAILLQASAVFAAPSDVTADFKVYTSTYENNLFAAGISTNDFGGMPEEPSARAATTKSPSR